MNPLLFLLPLASANVILPKQRTDSDDLLARLLNMMKAKNTTLITLPEEEMKSTPQVRKMEKEATTEVETTTVGWVTTATTVEEAKTEGTTATEEGSTDGTTTAEGEILTEKATEAETTGKTTTGRTTTAKRITTTSQETTTKPQAKCQDLFSRCHGVRELCYNKLYEKIMITSCAKTCGFCHRFVRLPTPERCVDTHPKECEIWGGNGFCHAYFYTMPEKVENCMKTCGLC